MTYHVVVTPTADDEATRGFSASATLPVGSYMTNNNTSAVPVHRSPPSPGSTFDFRLLSRDLKSAICDLLSAIRTAPIQATRVADGPS
jgi:hypothetical protein